MTETYTGVPGAATVLSRGASPGGGWGQPYYNLDAIDGLLAAAQPWSGTGPFFSGQSDLLIASNFGFAIPAGQNLMSIALSIAWQNGIAGQLVTPGASTTFDWIGLYYNGQLWGTLPPLLVSGPASGGPFTGQSVLMLFQAPGPNPPPIATINGAAFGVAIGCKGSVAGLSGISTSTPSTAPVVGIDQLLLTVQTYADDGVMYNYGEGRPQMSQRNGEFYPASRLMRDGDTGRTVGDDEYLDPHRGPQ